MNARNAFSKTKTPEKNRQFNLGLRGPLVVNKTSIRFNVDGRRDEQATPIVALDDSATGSAAMSVRRPSDSTNCTLGIEHALNNNDTLRLEGRGGTARARTTAPADSTCPSARLNRDASNYSFRAQLQGVVRKNSLNELRLQITGQTATTSISQAPAIIVQDAFSRGGAGATTATRTASSSLPTTSTSTSARSTRCASARCSKAAATSTSTRNANGTFTFRR